MSAITDVSFSPPPHPPYSLDMSNLQNSPTHLVSLRASHNGCFEFHYATPSITLNANCVRHVVTPKYMSIWFVTTPDTTTEHLMDFFDPTLRQLGVFNYALNVIDDGDDDDDVDDDGVWFIGQTELNHPFPGVAGLKRMSLTVPTASFPWGRQLATEETLQRHHICFAYFTRNTLDGNCFPTSISLQEAAAHQIEHHSQLVLPVKGTGVASLFNQTSTSACNTLTSLLDTRFYEQTTRATFTMDTVDQLCCYVTNPRRKNASCVSGILPASSHRTAVTVGSEITDEIMTTPFWFYEECDRSYVTMIHRGNGAASILISLDHVTRMLFGGHDKSPLATRYPVNPIERMKLCMIYALMFPANFGIDAVSILTARGRLVLSRAIVATAYRKGRLLPPPLYGRTHGGAKRGREETTETGYRGGLVLEAQRGLHVASTDKDDVICFYDFDSHYPVIMVDHAEEALPYEDITSVNRSTNLASTILSFINLKRESNHGSPERAVAKLTINGLYGSLGSQHSAIYCKRSAELITEFGRSRLELIATGRDVLFGHTDSIVCRLPRVEVESVVNGLLGDANSHCVLNIERLMKTFWCLSKNSHVGIYEPYTYRAIDDFVNHTEILHQELALNHTANLSTLANVGELIVAYASSLKTIVDNFTYETNLHHSGILNSQFPPCINVLSLVFAYMAVCPDTSLASHEARIRGFASFVKGFLFPTVDNTRALGEEHLTQLSPPTLADVIPWTIKIDILKYMPSRTGTDLSGTPKTDSNYRPKLVAEFVDEVGRRNVDGLGRWLYAYRSATSHQYEVVRDDPAAMALDKGYWIGRFIDHWTTIIHKTIGNVPALQRQMMDLLVPLTDLCPHVVRQPKQTMYRQQSVAPPVLASKLRADYDRIILEVPSVLPDAETIVRRLLPPENRVIYLLSADEVDQYRRHIDDYVVRLSTDPGLHGALQTVLFDSLLRRLDLSAAICNVARTTADLNWFYASTEELTPAIDTYNELLEYAKDRVIDALLASISTT